MPDRKPDIVLAIYDAFPDGFGDDLITELSANGAEAAAVRIPGGPFAGLELYLPTAVGLFLASSYFGGALQKMGEDHYPARKMGDKKLYQRISGVKITPVGSTGKVTGNNPYSLVFSITAEMGQGYTAKLLFKNEALAAEVDRDVNAFLTFMHKVHSDPAGDSITQSLMAFRPIGRTILVTYNPEVGAIVAVNALAGRS